jgi:trk system potassium uptake protein
MKRFAMAQFAIIGLGSFGGTIAIELINLKHDVLGIDFDKKRVENLSDIVTHAAIADATDEHVLDELNIQNCDAVVVAIGEDIEASILCVLHLKNLGIQKIWAKAKSKAHHMILTHLGVDKIIHPEEDMGVRIAQSLSYPMVSRYMALDDNHYIVKVEIKDQSQGIRLHTIMDHVPEIKTILHKRAQELSYNPDPNLILQKGDIIVIEGLLESLRRLSKYFLP